MRIGLIGCVKSKAATSAPAAELYTSALFRGRRAAVERSCDRWFVLSALHGLVAPDEVLEPYDLAMASLSVVDRRRWSFGVLGTLRERLGDLPSQTFEVHAGATYTDHGLVEGLRRDGAVVELPVAGRTLGQQLAWYAEHDRRTSPGAVTTAAPRTSRSSSAGARGGRYEPLRRHLVTQDGDGVTLSFDAVERLLGRPLPDSARRHRAWWSNGSHSQSRAWLDAGHEVDAVDQTAGWVRFRTRS